MRNMNDFLPIFILAMEKNISLKKKKKNSYKYN